MAETVLITGMGVVSPVGRGLDAYWTGLMSGMSNPADYPWSRPEYYPNRLAYYVRDPQKRDTSADGSPLGRASYFALDAAAMCLKDAEFSGEDTARVGVSIGTGMGHSDLHEAAREAGTEIPSNQAFMFRVASVLAAEFQLGGPNLSVSTACAAGGYSISLAVEAIRSGMADVVLAGGAEGFSRIALACFHRLGALDPVVCRPFDSARAGTVFGEGAAMLLLESASHARKRGCTRSYAEVSGYGWSCDGYHATAPEPSGREAGAALNDALFDAGISAGQIDCIVPHGTGTDLNDVIESEVLARILGERMDQVPVCSLKAMIGHTGGGAGAFSCLTGALILQRGAVPPTANLESVDPRCRIRQYRGEPLDSDIRNVLVNAYAFGGNNISIILGKN